MTYYLSNASLSLKNLADPDADKSYAGAYKIAAAESGALAAAPPIRTAPIPAVRLPAPVTRSVIMPFVAVLTPHTPHDHALVVCDRFSGQGRRVESEKEYGVPLKAWRLTGVRVDKS